MELFLIQLAIAVVMLTVSYIIMPKPKGPRRETQDLPNPTAEAGRPIPVLFGRMTITGTNVIWFGEKNRVSRS